MTSSLCATTNAVTWNNASQVPVLVSVEPKAESLYGQHAQCSVQSITYVDADKSLPAKKTACVTYGKNIRLAKDDRLNYYVSFGFDSQYYRFSPTGYGVYLSPFEDTIIVYASYSYINSSLLIYKNAASRFSKINAAPGAYYQFNLNNPDIPSDGTPLGAAGTPGISENGRYVVTSSGGTYADRGNVWRIDLETKGIVEVGRQGYNYTYTPLPAPSYAVSDDGQFIAETGGWGVKFWQVDDQCRNTTNWDSAYNGYDRCKNLTYFPYDHDDRFSATGYPSGSMPKFNDDATELTFRYRNNDASSPLYQLVLRAAGASEIRQLGYLALGDSYSSGEGDVGTKADGRSYYTTETDSAGGCHLSMRSYPFLLRDKWGISGSRMQSVACSGARIDPDYKGLRSSYFGQHGEISQQQNERDQEAWRDYALDEFVPGYVRQIEFVKKYQPKIVTLTGGGNDVGFMDVLEMCVGVGTCEYANSSSQLSKDLANSIDTQSIVIRDLIDKIKEASSNSRIILVGYPKFIKADGVCFFNSALLNEDERRMINIGLEQINHIFKSEAARAGIEYADVEDSLGGGQMCEGSEYVTGVWDVGIFNSINSKNQYARAHLFHPNAEGHTRLAADIFADSSVPPESEIVNHAPEEITLQYEFIDDSLVVEADSNTIISVPGLIFEPVSKIIVTGYSTPVDLGTFTANADGSMSAEVDLSSLGHGYHTVVLKGKSYSSEPVTYYQFITVAASEDDIDGDGIHNEDDRCQFVESWYDEATGNDICTEATSTVQDNAVAAEQIPTPTYNSQTYTDLESVFSSATLLTDNQVAHVYDGLGVTLPGNEVDSSLEGRSEDPAENNFRMYGTVGAVASLIAITGGIVYVKIKHRKIQ